jgi:hypothetical protein
MIGGVELSFFTIVIMYIVGIILVLQISRFLPPIWDKYLAIALLFIFLIIVSLRPDSFPDTKAYTSFFSVIDTYSYQFSFQRPSNGFETGFVNISKLLAIFIHSPKIYLFMIATLISIVWIFGIWMSVATFRSVSMIQVRLLPIVAIYVSYYGLMYTTIVLRAGIAIAFCSLSYALLFRKKYVWSIALALVSITIHRSIILYFGIIALVMVTPKLPIKVYRSLFLIITFAYILKVFDLANQQMISFVQFLYTKIPFFSFLDSYISKEMRNSSFLLTILFLMLQWMYISLFIPESADSSNKKNLGVGVMLCLLAGLFGFLPHITRGLDLVFFVTLPSLIAIYQEPAKRTIPLIEKIFLKLHLPQSIFHEGIFSSIIGLNFLLFSRWAGLFNIMNF